MITPLIHKANTIWFMYALQTTLCGMPQNVRTRKCINIQSICINYAYTLFDGTTFQWAHIYLSIAQYNVAKPSSLGVG